MNETLDLFANIDDSDKSRAVELRELIQKFDKAYYTNAESLISDREYDKLFDELKNIEKKRPDLLTPDSPTQRVGGEALKEFNSVKHDIPMLSLGNTYTVDEITEFNNRVLSGLEGEESNYVVELKYDGVAVSLKYVDCILSVGATRGDGVTGDDITQNIKTIKNIPLKVEPIVFNGVEIRNFEVRGEAYLTEEDFLKINEARVLEGEKEYANPRNLTAGTLKLLNSTTVAQRPLKIATYYLTTNDVKLESHSGNMELLTRMNFPVSPYFEKCPSFAEVLEYIEKWREKRYTLPFQIDGIVIKIDSMRQQDFLGSVGRTPRWAIAYKYEAESAITRLNSITFQVGRTGAVTPVAELEPTLLAGSTISRATLHNEDYILQRDIRVGDYVTIEKGGEVIPKVIGPVLEKRDLSVSPFEFPVLCPCELKSVLTRVEGEANRYCERPECPWQIRRRIEHFASRNAMNIEGLGEKVVDTLVSLGYINTISDIYDLHTKRDELIKLDRWGEKSVDNLIQAIENSKNIEFSKVLFAIGIRYIGERSAKLLANTFKNINELRAADYDKLISIREIGERIAKAIILYFEIEINQILIDKLIAHGLKFEINPADIQQNSDKLAGKTFVFTGELETMSRSAAAKLVETMGGKEIKSVSKKTDYVVVGANPGSKYDKALTLKVTVLDENAFLELIK